MFLTPGWEIILLVLRTQNHQHSIWFCAHQAYSSFSTQQALQKHLCSLFSLLFQYHHIVVQALNSIFFVSNSSYILISIFLIIWKHWLLKDFTELFPPYLLPCLNCSSISLILKCFYPFKHFHRFFFDNTSYKIETIGAQLFVMYDLYFFCPLGQLYFFPLQLLP